MGESGHFVQNVQHEKGRPHAQRSRDDSVKETEATQQLFLPAHGALQSAGQRILAEVFVLRVKNWWVEYKPDGFSIRLFYFCGRWK